MTIFGANFQTLEHSLDYAATKNKLISNNIANVDTPNYKAKDVVFKDVLNEKLKGSFKAKRTHMKHMKFGQDSHTYNIVTKNNKTYQHNGNNVDVDKEMAELAKNQIYYQSMIEQLQSKFKRLETVIRGGR